MSSPTDWDAYFDELNDFAKKNGIKNSDWSLVDVDFTISKFAEKHPFGKVKWVRIEYWGTKKTKIMGDTWLDIWKACDKAMRTAKSQHHPFIEFLEVKGNVINVACGS